jgi:hypothetical protein
VNKRIGDALTSPILTTERNIPMATRTVPQPTLDRVANACRNIGLNLDGSPLTDEAGIIIATALDAAVDGDDAGVARAVVAVAALMTEVSS